MASTDYESVLCVKNEVFVYKIPARSSNRGYRAADWTLDKPDWTGRLKIIAKGKDVHLRLEDKNSGDLFARCPVDAYPGIAVEQVVDSSRYFVLRITDEGGRAAFIGMGFSDRGDSFDLLVAMQDHFKWVRREEAQDAQGSSTGAEVNAGPKLDLGFKEGQTIKLNISTRRPGDSEDGPVSGKARPRARGSGTGLLPPPPGGASIKLPPPPGDNSLFDLEPPAHAAPAQPGGTQQSNSIDLFGDFLGGDSGAAQPVPSKPSDTWGDFTAATTTTASQQKPAEDDWVSFD